VFALSLYQKPLEGFRGWPKKNLGLGDPVKKNCVFMVDSETLEKIVSLWLTGTSMHLAMRPLEKIWVFMVDWDEHALIA